MQALPTSGQPAPQHSSYETVVARLLPLVADILGADVSPHQPLMEVRVLAPTPALDVSPYCSGRQHNSKHLRMGLQAGLDSLAAVDLRNSISTAFGWTLAPTAVFDHPTVAALAQAFAAAASEPSSSVHGPRVPRLRAGAASSETSSILADLILGVLGRVPDPDQPLMEVSM